MRARPVRTLQALNEAAVFMKAAPKRMCRTPPAEFMLAARTKLGLSQTELAERAGMPQQQLQRLESGRINARLNTWRRVFDALHCDLLVLPRPRRHLGETKARRVLEGL
ncbi:MAG: helix-turn-helix transcriptional regulator [Elusimicrobiota bacterium]